MSNPNGRRVGDRVPTPHAPPVQSLTRRGIATLLLALVLAAPPAAGAEPAGRIAGRVTDTTGEPLPAVIVEVHAPAGAPTHTQTGPDGRYAFDGIAPGTYTLSFQLQGFVTLDRRGVAVTADATAVQDVTLFVAATTSVVVTGRQTFRNLSLAGEQDALIGVADAASTGVITAAELDERARRRPAEALEAVPGVVVSQHSGEGKANQYYLRGFNLDHGTDLALSVAGMPVNLPTHGHGQGYADMNFLIPELVSGIQYRKGPYAAEQGDFAAAGAIRVNYLNRLDGPIGRIEGGMFGYGRVLAAASPQVGRGHLLVAAEAMGNDGPWDRPDVMRRVNGLVRYSQGTATSGFAVTGLSYVADWNSSDQIPRRAVQDGLIDRFGYLDRTNGGETHRVGGIVEWQRTGAGSLTRLEGFGFGYGLGLYSNFTYALDDEENGDQFEQRDERFVAGARASHAWAGHLFDRHTEVTVGAQARRDDIGELGLYRTASRQRLSAVREDAVDQTSGALYGEVTTRWSDTFRTTLGVRGDLYAWDVDAGDPANAGRETAGIVNPKLSVAVGPWQKTEFYANAGGGFHSNDGRGATITRDPATGDPVDRVDPLVRARGAELGVRTLAVRGLHTTVTAWGLWLDSELLFIGDAGTTEASRPSRRLGIEWDADYRATSWLSLESSVAWSWARFTDGAPDGDHIPGAIEGVVMAGATVTPGDRWTGSLRWRHFGPRPLIEDDSVRSQDSNLWNAEVGYRLTRALRLKADLLNVFGSKSSDIDYFYTSRLQGEPAGGVDDIHFHPVEPFTLRVALVATF
jgi:hypothetical protein